MSEVDLRAAGRILYVSSVDVSIGNGPGVNEREFILGLRAAIGDRAHFLVPRPAQEAVDLPVEACTFAYPHHGHSIVSTPLHMLSEVYLAHKLLARGGFNLIVFRLDVLPLGPFMISRLHRTPYALKTLGQGMINVLDEKLGWLGKGLSSLNLALVRRLLDDAILADSVSTAQVELLSRLFGSNARKIVWIDNAVNMDRFFPSSTAQARTELGLTAFDPIVGYVGTRPWERGAAQLVAIVPRLLTRFPRLGVVVLGDGKGIDGLKRKAHELGVEEHCVFAGYVPFDRVPLFINSLDVGVSISLRPDRSAASELKVRQYLACGKPVVLSPGSNDFVSVHHFGSIVEPTDLNRIGDALEQWLSLSAAQRENFACRAAQYMTDHLSINGAITKRLAMWSDQLAAQQRQLVLA